MTVDQKIANTLRELAPLLRPDIADQLFTAAEALESELPAAPVPPRGAEPQEPTREKSVRSCGCGANEWCSKCSSAFGVVVPPQLVMLLRQYASDIDTCGMEACSAMRDEIVNEMREAADMIERMK